MPAPSARWDQRSRPTTHAQSAARSASGRPSWKRACGYISGESLDDGAGRADPRLVRAIPLALEVGVIGHKLFARTYRGPRAIRRPGAEGPAHLRMSVNRSEHGDADLRDRG